MVPLMVLVIAGALAQSETARSPASRGYQEALKE